MKRYVLGAETIKGCAEIVLYAEDGVQWKVEDEASDRLICKAFKAEDIFKNIYSGNYVRPVIPDGYKYVAGAWNEGFTIEREADGSQFVWVPVGSLPANGTLDGINFIEKFGRRNFQRQMFSDAKIHEHMTPALAAQMESVKNYGGFYVSAFNISMGNDGKIHAVKGAMPMTNVSCEAAKQLAESFETGKTLKSHLLYGAEYDSILEWMIASKAYNRRDITSDSSHLGNFANCENQIEKTGSNENWKMNNIYDLAGNVNEWTMEQFGKASCDRIVRGGAYCHSGSVFSVAYRGGESKNSFYPYTGFRVALEIK